MAAGAQSDAEDAELAGLLHVCGCDNDSNFKERYDPNLSEIASCAACASMA